MDGATIGKRPTIYPSSSPTEKDPRQRRNLRPPAQQPTAAGSSPTPHSPPGVLDPGFKDPGRPLQDPDLRPRRQSPQQRLP
jgi:hypothetical protein